MEIYLKDQATILVDIRSRVRDPDGERWQDEEIYGAINDALLAWHGRVRVPHIYTLEGGWVSGTFEYVLPDYIRSGYIQPQMRANTVYDQFSLYQLSSETWVDIPGWRIEPNASNQRVLRFNVSPYTTDGRIIWWGSNSPLPEPGVSLKTTIDADDTSIVLDGIVDCLEYGWLKIENEWIQYAGLARSTDTTLTAAARGLPQGAVAATHTAPLDVYFGVAMPRLELYRVLMDQVLMHLHELYLGNAAAKESQLHQEMIGYYSARVEKFWKNWSDTKSARQRIDISPWVMM